jgi:hypothetical protein
MIEEEEEKEEPGKEEDCGANMNLMGLNVIVNKDEHFHKESSFLLCDLFLLLVCHQPCSH